MIDFAVITGIVVGLTQLIKGLVPSTLVPLTSVVLAVLITGAWGASQGMPLIPSLIEGLISGLTANGLYDNVKVPLTA